MKVRTALLIGGLLGYSMSNGLAYFGIKNQLNYTEEHYGRRIAESMAKDRITWYENLSDKSRFAVTLIPGVLGNVGAARDFLDGE